MMSLFLLAGSAGAVPSEEWNRTFTGAGNAIANSVQQTGDGGYILAGEHSTLLNLDGLLRPMHGVMNSGTDVQ